MLGHTDSPATPAGIAACRARGQGLAWDRIASSDLRRARACAEAIAGHVVSGDPRWRELDFGQWDGLAAAEIDAGALTAFWADPDAGPPPGGERWSALVARVGEVLASIDGTTLVVTHAGAIRAALAHLCGFDHRQVWSVHLPYAALLSLRLWRGQEPTAQIVALHT